MWGYKMTVIIKSNQKATKSLGNIFGIKGPIDYSLILDFNQQIYLKKKSGTQQISLSEAISLTRNTKATYLDETGLLKTAEPNEARIHFDPISGKKGLLLEASHTQLLTNIYTPLSQSINVTHNVNDRLILSCKGSGRVSLSGNVSLVEGSPAYASENSPAMYQTTATGPVNVTVTGSLEVFSLHFVSSASGASAKMFTPSGLTSVSPDACKLNPDLFNEILGGLTEYTILMNVRECKRPAPSAYASRNTVFALIDSSPNDKKGVHLSRNLGSAPRFSYVFLNADNTIVKNRTLLAADTIYNQTYVLSHSNNSTEAYVARNGEVNAAEGAFSLSQKELVLGSPTSYISTSCLNGIITMLVVYPYKMTYAQVQELSKSLL